MGRRELKILIPVIIIAIGWIAKWMGYIQVFNVAMLVAALVFGYDVGKSALLSLRYGIISINLLVMIAAIGGIYLGEYWEAAAVTFLFVFGSYLEARALGKTRDALASLIKVAPSTANVIRDGEIVEADIDEVTTGDVVVVRPGEKVPVDGVIVKGQAAIDEATITGESIPRSKTVGDRVFSTTINTEGYLEIQTEKVGEDTLFARIMHMVEESQEKKANTQRFIEKFAKYYTPGIIVLSIVTYLFTRDLRLAITFLVIACPGALVISTPVSIVSAIGNAAKNGIIVKGGGSLEKGGRIKVVAFDKTGTLTKGKPKVYHVHGFGMGEDEVLALAAACESYSEHPLARAILEKAEEKGLSFTKPDDFEVVVGRGVKAKIGQENYYVGSLKLVRENGVSIVPEAEALLVEEEEKGYTAIVLAGDSGVKGIISIRDEVKEDSLKLVQFLRRKGVKTFMLTGDNERVANAVSKELGLDGYYAGLLPDEKLAAINELKGHGQVVMVGDGVNDAPSLAEADMGIAVKGATDVTAETADLVIMSEKMDKIAYAIGLSQATLRNLQINIGFSILVVLALLVGVIRGDIFLASGMFFHELSVILVTFNGMRLMGVNERQLGLN
jgi:Cd2+/Zn2+-exporting ATPase